jgi:O-antigen/teichoic acid export membrane protein
MNDQNREYATFGKQVGYVIGSNIAGFLLGFIQIPILTKGLGATLYGTWSLINVAVALIVPFALISLNIAVVRFLAVENDKERIREDFFSICCVVFISAAFFSFSLYSLSDLLAIWIIKDSHSYPYIKLASILILLNCMEALFLSFFRMQKKIGIYTILSLGSNVLQVILCILFILLGYKLKGVIIAVIMSGVFFNLIAFSIILRETKLKFPRFSRIKSFLAWGIPLAPNTAILWIIHSSDRYMVSYFLGVTDVGIYSAAYTIGNYTSFILAPLGIVLYPVIARHYDEGNLNEARKYLKYSSKYLMMIVIPSAFGLSILAKPLLQELTLPQFVAGSVVVPFVAFGAVLFCFYQICVYIIHLVGKTKITLRLLGTSSTLNIVLNVLLIPHVGILGAALATLISYGVLGILTLLVTRRYLKFDLSAPFLLKSILASAIMAGCIRFLNPQSISLILVSIMGGAIIYFSVLFLVGGFSLRELNFLKAFVLREVPSR